MIPCRAGTCLRSTGICLAWMSIVTDSVAAESGKAVISPLATLGKLALALIIVLAVFWIFARVMRQVQNIQGDMHQALRIIGALSVGQRERVVVVQVGEEQLVLGVTSNQINTLHVLQEPLSSGSNQTQSSDFRAKLSAALKRQVPGE